MFELLIPSIIKMDENAENTENTYKLEATDALLEAADRLKRQNPDSVIYAFPGDEEPFFRFFLTVEGAGKVSIRAVDLDEEEYEIPLTQEEQQLIWKICI